MATIDAAVRFCLCSASPFVALLRAISLTSIFNFKTAKIFPAFEIFECNNAFYISDSLTRISAELRFCSNSVSLVVLLTRAASFLYNNNFKADNLASTFVTFARISAFSVSELLARISAAVRFWSRSESPVMTFR